MEISSQTVGAISEALAKAQGAMGKAIKDSANPFFKSKYADLSNIMDACQKPLSENGLAFTSSVIQENGIYTLIGTLSHSSGEWFRSYFPLILAKQDMQSFGSALSYARRYVLSSLASVAVCDDDAESTMQRDCQETKPQINKPSVAAPKISESQYKYLASLLAGEPTGSHDAICDSYGVEHLKDLTTAQASEVINNIKSKQGK